jgi:F-type H+-transporting ATPase subunit alpha
MAADDRAVAVEDVRRYEEDLYRFLEARAAGVLTGINDKKILDDETKSALEAALNEFNKQFVGTTAGAAA